MCIKKESTMRINPISVNFSYNNRVNKYAQRPVLPAMKCDTVSFTGAAKPNPKTVVILLGAPNSGKGTLARKISEKLTIPQISTGDILRGEVKKASELGLQAQKFMNSGGLVPDELIMKIFQKRISEADCQKGFILDGFPRTINQAKQLDEILNNEKDLAVKIINLDVDKNILFERSANRYVCADCSRTYSIKENYNKETSKCDCGGSLIKRADDTPEILAQRLEAYDKQTLPLVNYYGDKVSDIGIHGEDVPMGETLSRVMKHFEG